MDLLYTNKSLMSILFIKKIQKSVCINLDYNNIGCICLYSKAYSIALIIDFGEKDKEKGLVIGLS